MLFLLDARARCFWELQIFQHETSSQNYFWKMRGLKMTPCEQPCFQMLLMEIFSQGIDVGNEVGQDNSRPVGLQVVQYIYTVAFTVEIVMRLLADREERKCRSDDCLWRLSRLISEHLISFLICGPFDFEKGASDIVAWIIARKCNQMFDTFNTFCSLCIQQP